MPLRLAGQSIISLHGLAALAMIGCTHTDVPEYVNFSAPAELNPIKIDRSEFDRLKDVLERYPDEREHVDDIVKVLSARQKSQAGDNQAALPLWFQAARSAPAPFGKDAFEGWIRSLALNRPATDDLTAFTREVIEKSEQGRLIPYMLDRKLTSPFPLMKRIKSIVPERYGQTLIPEDGIKVDRPVPVLPGVPERDPLLLETGKLFCISGALKSDEWKKWETTLDRVRILYWKAIAAECDQDEQQLISSYQAATTKLVREEKFGSLAVYAAGRLATLFRSAGDRQKAADAFRDLMLAWKIKDVSYLDFGDERYEFKIRELNDALWSSRYRAIVGDIELAEDFALRAQEIARSIDQSEFQKKATVKEKFWDLYAESAHILAFRVNLERGAYENAANIVERALSEMELSDEWRERFRWTRGLYKYMAGDLAHARVVWEEMSSDTKLDEYRPRLYYWLSRVHKDEGHLEESAFFLKSLREEYPLSFYAVVAPEASGMAPAGSWASTFKSNFGQMSATLSGRREYGLQDWRSDKRINNLLSRGEILNLAQLFPAAQDSFRELEREVKKNRLSIQNLDKFLYLTRSQYSSRDYFRSIWLTTELANEIEGFWQKFPEQLLIYFPIPAPTVIEESAADVRVDPAMLLAVSRQESSFRTDVVSGAGAVGVMQLMPKTAERVNREEQVGLGKIELNDPSANYKLGGAYLAQLGRRYMGFYPAIFAAYNAGEYAVDVWLERRKVQDPILWLELIPFKETNDYAKNVWRNYSVYQLLQQGRQTN